MARAVTSYHHVRFWTVWYLTWWTVGEFAVQQEGNSALVSSSLFLDNVVLEMMNREGYRCATAQGFRQGKF